MSKAGYKLDLSALLAECESNYLRLLKLLPNLEQTDQRRFGVSAPGEGCLTIKIDVLERAKYTTTLRISQLPPQDGWLPESSLTARLYHDAEVAEVIHYENMKQLKAHYPYPNRLMYQRDEKMQLNSFLGEWLTNCLAHGFNLGEHQFISA